MKKMFERTAAILMVVMLAVFAVSACGGGSSGTAATNSAANTFGGQAPRVDRYMAEPAMVETIAETTAAAMDAGGVYAYDGEAGGYERAFDTSMTEIPMPEEAEEDIGTGSEGNDGEQTSKANRKLIRTVSLSVETTEFENLLGKISQAVESDGGYIEQSDVSGNSISYSGVSRRYAYLTVRVPSHKLDGFLDQVSEQSNVINRSESVEDVTLQYTDVESRKKSLTIEQERLWELLEQADSVDSIIALESRLSEIRYQLEGYESQLRTYDNQVDYSTVHIDVQEVGVFTPTEPDSVLTRIQKGFKRNLEGVGTGLVDLFVWFLSSLPSIVLLLVVLAVIWLIIKAVIRKTGGKRKMRKLRLPGRKSSAGQESRGPEAADAGQKAEAAEKAAAAQSPEATEKADTGQKP